MARVRVASVKDVEPGALTLVELGERRLALARVGDAIHAIDDTCTHHGGPLSEGRLAGTRVTCPWHGWMFDVRTGQCVMPSRGGPVACYAVTVDGGDVFVDVGGPEMAPEGCV